MKRLITVLGLVLVLGLNVYSQVKYTDQITGQSYEGWEAVGVWIWDHNSEVGTTIVCGFGVGCLIESWVDERNNGCKIRLADRFRSKRRIKSRRRRNRRR